MNVFKNQYFISILLIVSVAFFCFIFIDWVGYRSVALLLLLSVSILAMRFQVLPVLLAATLSALIWDFFFIPPHFTFLVTNKDDILMLIMYFVVALLNTVFNFKLREFKQIEYQKEEKEKSIKLYNTLFDSLSHELRTPIATILGASDVLKENDTILSNNDKQELMSDITNSALRLQNQVENLLNTSRLEAGFLKPNMNWCDINELINSVLNKLKSDKHCIVFEVQENLPFVKIDYGLTEQVIGNLLVNALNHTSEAVTISINIAILTEHSGAYNASKAVFEADKNAYKLRIEISDEGEGIPEMYHKAIFDKFFRLNNSKTGGIGLGLYISKGLIEAQGGVLWASNRATKGMIFSIEIPTPILSQNISYE